MKLRSVQKTALCILALLITWCMQHTFFRAPDPARAETRAPGIYSVTATDAPYTFRVDYTVDETGVEKYGIGYDLKNSSGTTLVASVSSLSRSEPGDYAQTLTFSYLEKNYPKGGTFTLQLLYWSSGNRCSYIGSPVTFEVVPAAATPSPTPAPTSTRAPGIYSVTATDAPYTFRVDYTVDETGVEKYGIGYDLKNSSGTTLVASVSSLSRSEPGDYAQTLTFSYLEKNYPQGGTFTLQLLYWSSGNRCSYIGSPVTFEVVPAVDPDHAHHLVSGTCSICGASFDLSGLDAIVVPESTLDVKDEAFLGVNAEVIVLPGGCRSIGSRAFANCENLRYVVLPEGIGQVAEDAFEGSDPVLLYQ